MIARVFVPQAAAEGEQLELPPEEAGHLVRVLRLAPGAPLRVFDGRGREWEAILRATTKHGAVVELGMARTAAPEPRVRYTLAVAVLKGDATDGVVRDAVMLGVSAIRPFLSARTEIRQTALESGHRRARWERVAVASAKQCGRAVLPTIHDPVNFTAVLAADPAALRLLLVEPAVEGEAARPAEVAPPAAACLAVGPEGGWTPEEAAQAIAAGWRPLRVGTRVLRAESAPLVALAACQAVWSDD